MRRFIADWDIHDDDDRGQQQQQQQQWQQEQQRHELRQLQNIPEWRHLDDYEILGLDHSEFESGSGNSGSSSYITSKHQRNLKLGSAFRAQRGTKTTSTRSRIG